MDFILLQMPAFFLVIVVFTITILLIRYRLTNTFPEDKESNFGFYLFRQHLEPADERLLEKTFTFYRKMNDKKKRQFNSRVKKFILEKKFEGRDRLEVTREMLVLIASTAIRVTWGLRNYNFPSFHTIIIYPEKFYSGFSKAVVKGETNMAGLIVFSWKDFLFGISDSNDNLNLGYHEFGHALFVERFRQTVESSFERNYNEWDFIVNREKKLKEAALKNTFREYATYNEHEFFAVAVENFFERPEKFKNDLPKLYYIMTKLLKQDPLAQVKRYDQRSF